MVVRAQPCAAESFTGFFVQKFSTKGWSENFIGTLGEVTESWFPGIAKIGAS